jgi:soluble lytic murein transglycosylase-like protein
MALFTSVSIQYGLPVDLLSSLCYVESKHNIATIHVHDGNSSSFGVCQIKLKTARGLGFRGTEKQLMEPKYNVKYAGKYLKHQLIRYHGNVEKAVIAYNMGHAGDLTTSRYQVKVFNKWKEQTYAKN